MATIHLKLLTANGLTLAQEDAVLVASEDAKKGRKVKETKNLAEMKSYLDSLKSS
ncbi:MAG: hypothetical protein WC843_02425 [Candidatus Gracilibacteria bacterium]|jgi:hypothetical protein